MKDIHSIYATMATWEWGSVPDWIVATTAVFGATAVVYQLRALRKSTEVDDHSNRLERLKIRLELDREFEHSQLNSSRQRLFSLARKISKERTGKISPSVDLSEENTTLVSLHLTDLWKQARSYSPPVKKNEAPPDAYLELMRFPYWLDTIGNCCQKGLLKEDEFLEL